MYAFFYRLIMRLAHHFHWHYAPPIYPQGDTLLWCKWCGFRAVVERRHLTPFAANESQPEAFVNAQDHSVGSRD